MSDKIYVIDACSLIEAAHRYNMSKKTFAYIWETLENEIKKGCLISSTEIFDELKDKDLVAWAKKNKQAFMPLCRETQQKTKEILEKYPLMIKMRSSKNSNGDPFLIATAMVFNAIVITNEGPKANGIPAVCHGLGIEYMNLDQYLDLILE